MTDGADRRNVWAIVLAGGDGVRTKEFLRHWLGYEKPKQSGVRRPRTRTLEIELAVLPRDDAPLRATESGD